MAYIITDDCIACDLCVDQCPIGAIAPGDPVYLIDETCCDFEECLVACPVDAIVPLETHEDAEPI